MIERFLNAGHRVGRVKGDEVYGGNLGLRAGLEERGIGYVLAVACSAGVHISASTFRADALAWKVPKRAWQKLSAGHGAKGHRFYDWASSTSPSRPRPPPPADRRNCTTGELARYRCHSPTTASLTNRSRSRVPDGGWRRGCGRSVRRPERRPPARTRAPGLGSPEGVGDVPPRRPSGLAGHRAAAAAGRGPAAGGELSARETATGRPPKAVQGLHRPGRRPGYLLELLDALVPVLPDRRRPRTHHRRHDQCGPCRTSSSRPVDLPRTRTTFAGVGPDTTRTGSGTRSATAWPGAGIIKSSRRPAASADRVSRTSCDRNSTRGVRGNRAAPLRETAAWIRCASSRFGGLPPPLE